MNYAQPAKKKVRIFTWVIVAINVLFLIWLISGIVRTTGDATDCGTLSQHTCNDAKHLGTAIGIGILVFLWAAVDLILGVVWLVTRPRDRRVIVYQPAPVPQAVAGWYPDPQDPQRVRYWDGLRFTSHTAEV